MSVTVPSVPRSVDRTTVPPLVVRLFPLASLSCTVMVEVELPSAAMLVGFAVMVEVAKEAVPTVMATVALLLKFAPANVPLIVAVPAVVDEVRIAV